MKAALLVSSLIFAQAVPAPDGLPQQHPLGHVTQSRGQSKPGFWPSGLMSSTASNAVDQTVEAFESALEAAQRAASRLSHRLEAALDEHGDGGHKHRDWSGKTIYQQIHACKYTSRFAKLVDKYPDIVKLLNGTHRDSNITLFVPVDKAFEDPHRGHKHYDDDDKEATEKLLRYHIGIGEYPALRILATNTLPTALHQERLGGDAQRLRTSVGLGGVEVNFYSKVVAADFKASNGIIHGVNHILAPPPPVGLLLTAFPSHFSTLLLAYEKTDFVNFVHGVHMPGGSTVFAPSNGAFTRLGEKTNSFLFNTGSGRKYLSALLKYHIVPNATLYSDAYYDHVDSETKPLASRREHYDLTTLLGDSRVSADVLRWAGFAFFRINGFAHVSVRDGVAGNGVVQVLDSVLIPPHKHSATATDNDSDTAGSMDVEELKARLEPYL
ncbi:hypothetical protein CDD81_702 [Ophiocordyceps australis]|uniref:FAS1 domain-containing protein n=1 Tax=Ophiocordyceps australis TaxID=1399860 RepID=A0A2C5X8G0_9HYPO|nr:hypothetical protein CDD81_702 [Ophiocordyceps australis]